MLSLYTAFCAGAGSLFWGLKYFPLYTAELISLVSSNSSDLQCCWSSDSTNFGSTFSALRKYLSSTVVHQLIEIPCWKSIPQNSSCHSVPCTVYRGTHKYRILQVCCECLHPTDLNCSLWFEFCCADCLSVWGGVCLNVEPMSLMEMPDLQTCW